MRQNGHDIAPAIEQLMVINSPEQGQYITILKPYTGAPTPENAKRRYF